MSQVAAAALWGALLAADPLDPPAGRRLRDELFASGASRDPRDLLSRLLGPGALRQVAGGCGLDLASRPLQDLDLLG